MSTANFKRQWADGPMPLIESPLKKLVAEGRKPTGAELCAIEMSNIHNIFIRGINCMLLQAPHLKTAQDQADMTRFAYALAFLIHEHHEVEETLFFPLIEQATGTAGIMDRNVVQHEAFSPGFHSFDRYVKQMINGVAVWDADKFVGLINTFASLLTTHLTDEIPTLLGLEKYNLDLEPMLKKVAEYAIAHVEKYHAIPIFMQSMDITYEDNIHKTHGHWPPLPWFPQMLFRWMYIPKHKGAWRFACCDTHGVPKELPFAPLKEAKVANGNASASS